MKRTYEKPDIIFEDFSLSTNIAGDCDTDTNVQSQNNCGMFFEGLGNVFLTGMGGCDGFQVEIDGAFNGICYHVPDGNNNLFNS